MKFPQLPPSLHPYLFLQEGLWFSQTPLGSAIQAHCQDPGGLGFLPLVWQLVDSWKFVPFAGAPMGCHWALPPHGPQQIFISREKQEWPFPALRMCLSCILPMTHRSQNCWADEVGEVLVGGELTMSPTQTRCPPASLKPDLRVL